MARETLRDFLTSIGSGEDSISYKLRDDSGDGSFGKGDDLGVDPNTGKELVDLTDNEKGLLGDYLNFIQAERNVIFNVSPGNTEAVSSDRGASLPPAENQGADKVFIETGNSSPMSVELGMYSNSGQFDTADTSLDQIVDKTSGEDGHDLLSKIGGRALGTEGDLSVNPPIQYKSTPIGDREKYIVNASVNILRNNNRFSPAGDTIGDAFSERGKTDQELDEEQILTSQREFGEYDKNPSVVSFEELSKIGGSLLKASLGIEGDVNSIAPEDLRAKNAEGFPVINDATKEVGLSTRSGRGDFLTLDRTDASDSIGSMTSTGDASFDPSNKWLLRARAIAGIKTALVAIDAFKSIALESSGGIDALVNPSRSPHISGKNKYYVQLGMSMIMNSILVPTDRPYTNCVNMGARIMFGLDKSLSDVASESDIKDENLEKSKIIMTSPGFSLVLARSILSSINRLNDTMSDLSGEDFDSVEDAQEIINKLGRTRIIGVLNSLAIVGDISLSRAKSNSGNFGFPRSNSAWDVDSLPDGPSTRVSKSRTSDGHNVSALSMRTSATPSAYVLPVGVLRAVSRMGMSNTDTNPARLLASTVGKKIYAGQSISNGGRIPASVVHRLEDLLDSEYVPFYFHDIRTNEIVAFHAFLDSLSDGFTANFTETGGYGRMDPVQTYSNTKRAISFSFTIAATSPEDFDEMWFKINKLTTLVYPQWTKGDMIEGPDSTRFVQPFSQIVGASPLMRLRVGDVIKGNYSKFNLGRIFGVGEAEANLEPPSGVGGISAMIASALRPLKRASDEVFLKIFLAAFGSPVDLLQPGGLLGVGGGGPLASRLESAATKLLGNGFVNPILGTILKKFEDPDNDISEMIPGAAGATGYDPTRNSQLFGTRVFIKATQAYPYRVIGKDGVDLDTFETVRFSRPVLGIVIGREVLGMDALIERFKDHFSQYGVPPSDNIDKSKSRTLYTVSIIDWNVPDGFRGANLIVTHSDIIHDPSQTFSRFMMPILSPGAALTAAGQNLANEAGSALGIDASGLSIFLSQERRFLSAENNAITRGFESTRGRGLAGVLKGLNFEWLSENTTWEIDWGSRAPKFCKVSCTFAPIHDIPPGMDHEGFNRAPIYNVGRLSRAMGGDAYDDDGRSSQEMYDLEHRKTFKNE